MRVMWAARQALSLERGERQGRAPPCTARVKTAASSTAKAIKRYVACAMEGAWCQIVARTELPVVKVGGRSLTAAFSFKGGGGGSKTVFLSAACVSMAITSAAPVISNISASLNRAPSTSGNVACSSFA
ncbi:hypothetical protein ACP4OV_013060 [Aristida adscensionis]